MNEKTFKGPIFIVGLGRSGTKLLRDLLNNHPKISIPEDETGFIPELLKRFDSKDIKSCKNEMLEVITRSPFYISQKQKGGLNKSIVKKLIFNSQNIKDVIEKINRFCSPKGAKAKYIWGDKTPSYIKDVLLLNKYFDGAKFIHIYRDVRDYSLSYKRTWGKGYTNSAYKWDKRIKHFEGNKNKINYIEISYEDLLVNTQNVLKSVCAQIGVEYKDEITQLREPVEVYGDAQQSDIKKNNFNKYKTHLNKDEVLLIESIAFDSMKLKGYDIEYAKSKRNVSSYSLFFYKLYDFLAFSYHIIFKERGFINGLKYILSSIRLKLT